MQSLDKTSACSIKYVVLNLLYLIPFPTGSGQD